MGLDMYLIANSRRLSEAINQNNADLADYENAYVRYRRRNGIVAQWRKANQIHRWFVEHIQDGNDNCGYYVVHPDELKELLGAVNEVLGSTKLVSGMVQNGKTYVDGKGWVANMCDGKVLEDDSVAKAVLPVQDGFFFGGTEYDQYYWQDLIDTKEQLEAILWYVGYASDGNGWEYPIVKGEEDWELTIQYHASW